MALRFGFVAWSALLACGLSSAMAMDDLALDPTVVAAPNYDAAPVSAPDHVWNVSAEALWLQRANGRPTVSSAGTAGSNIEESFAGDAFEPGLRLEVRRIEEDGSAWELGYFGLNRWDQTSFVLGDPIGQSVLVSSPTLRLDDLIGGFDAGIVYNYTSRVHNAELNRWWVQRQWGEWTISRMVGVRYFEFQERLIMGGADTIFGLEVFFGETYNALLGGQVGFKAERHWDRLEAYGMGKLGLYGNNYQSGFIDGVLSPFGLPPLVFADNDGIGVAGLLEMRLGAKYLLTDHIALTTGYNLMYIPGLALQPSPHGLGGDHDGGLVLHGLSLGAEIAW
ncbi:MAG: hypothetical protein QM811_24045 [Pirellulales bacterium]